jgi:hypothetical protein
MEPLLQDIMRNLVIAMSSDFTLTGENEMRLACGIVTDLSNHLPK